MILNQTQNKFISEKEKICQTLFSQALGLMFRRKQNLIMAFPEEKKVRLHNFFVFYPIDVLILDRNQEIVEIKKDFKPFTFWNSQKEGRFVVELASLKSPGEYQMGDKLTIK